LEPENRDEALNLEVGQGGDNAKVGLGEKRGSLTENNEKKFEERLDFLTGNGGRSIEHKESLLEIYGGLKKLGETKLDNEWGVSGREETLQGFRTGEEEEDGKEASDEPYGIESEEVPTDGEPEPYITEGNARDICGESDDNVEVMGENAKDVSNRVDGDNND
jgi:hypothetical protein